MLDQRCDDCQHAPNSLSQGTESFHHNRRGYEVARGPWQYRRDSAGEATSTFERSSGDEGSCRSQLTTVLGTEQKRAEELPPFGALSPVKPTTGLLPPF